MNKVNRINQAKIPVQTIDLPDEQRLNFLRKITEQTEAE
jgi:hypothetical protein